MLAWRISKDRKVAALSCPTARLLYTWMIAHADNLGRMDGDPEMVRLNVIPLEPGVRTEDVSTYLFEMQKQGLIRWYVSDSGQVIELSAWKKHQRLAGNMRKASDFPGPFVQGTYDVRTEVEGEVEGEEEEKPAAACARANSIAPENPAAAAGSADAPKHTPQTFPRELLEQLQEEFTQRDVHAIAAKVLTSPRVRNPVQALRSWIAQAEREDTDRRVQTSGTDAGETPEQMEARWRREGILK